MKNNSNDLFLGVAEVQDKLSISRSSAYRVIKNLNEELSSKGFYVINGRVNRQYFYERFYFNGALRQGGIRQ